MCEVLRKQQQELHQRRPLSDAERLKFTREIKGTDIMCLYTWLYIFRSEYLSAPKPQIYFLLK